MDRATVLFFLLLWGPPGCDITIMVYLPKIYKDLTPWVCSTKECITLKWSKNHSIYYFTTHWGVRSMFVLNPKVETLQQEKKSLHFGQPRNDNDTTHLLLRTSDYMCTVSYLPVNISHDPNDLLIEFFVLDPFLSFSTFVYCEEIQASHFLVLFYSTVHIHECTCAHDFCPYIISWPDIFIFIICWWFSP